ncbi:uncharacterized protein LOC103864720 [Brassica rapa]|uniref:uncharacterized protein LOC103864720 n=1 Tax=Brassica campestris TaxID=3711 RepID=UPI00142D7EB9|nr:uncharacterized protein LOC103864720 [Brassica rapa]
MSVSVKVKCFHSGRFKDEGGLCYVDGTVDEFELDADSLFTNLVMKMFEKRIVIGKLWFKLPFHELEDRKPLFENVEANKKRMESSARWYKELDIYVERDRVVLAEEGSTNVGVQERGMNVEPEEEGLHDRAEKQCEKLCEKLAEKNSETGLMFDEDEDEALDTLYDPLADDSDDEKCSEDALSESSESNDEAEVVEEDIVDIDNVNYEEQIPDEDEVYPATDDSSGDEEEQAERLVQRGLPDGVFSLRQLFSSGSEFKKNVIRYILKTGRNVVFDRWEKTKLGAKCGEKNCGWRIYCSVEEPIGKWMVKVYEDEHQCHPVGRCKLIKSPVVADLFLEDIRRDPEMSAPEIKDEMKRRYNIIISPAQSQVARRLIFDKLQAETDEQFARLRDYEHEIKRTNKNTTVEINTTRREDGSEAFSQMYLCFAALKTSWKQHCRPVIGLDGTFLKHSMQGMILTAIGRDPNNQIYPIAWAVVSSENNDNWEWFIHKVKVDLDLGEGDEITIISDMHRSLIHGVATELPKAEHRACARHIYANLKKLHKSDTLKPMFWRVASSYNEADFKQNLAAFREFDPLACDELLKRDHRTWCRAFFRIGCCCADTHNNLTESFNRTLKVARKKPFVQMLELIRRDAMQRIANRFEQARKEPARHTKKARKEVEKSCDEAQHCRSVSSTGGRYEVVEGTNGYSVKLHKRTCACRKWDLTGIPCRHAVCAIRENTGLVEDYISDYYTTEKWRETYRRDLKPVNGPKFWAECGGGRIVGPPYKRPPGRPKGKARIKGVHESPSKKRVGRKGRVPHCGICSEKGHNSRTCPTKSPETRKKRRWLSKQCEEDAEEAAARNGQDEANDEAQETAEMEADLAAQMEDQVEVEFISSTAPQPSQPSQGNQAPQRNLRRSSRLAALLFG